MSSEHAGGSAPGADPEAGAPSEEELRAAYEAELDRITASDLILQAAVSLLNVGGRRMGAPPGAPADATPGRDLEQVRDAIDGVSALLGILERRMPRELAPLRDALSQLQLAYARETQAAGATGASAGGAPQGAQGKEQQGTAEQQKDAGREDQDPRGPGPAEASGRLWVPDR